MPPVLDKPGVVPSGSTKDMGDMMPMPASDEVQSSFMARCVAHMLNCCDDLTEAAATAHCQINWDNRETMDKGAKGARNKGLVYKTVAGKAADGMTYVLSDNTLDRMGDIIDPTGWDLKWFKQNPIALFGHQSSFPIGNWANVRVEGNKLMAELVPAQRGTSQRVDEIISLIDQNVLRATSVGFRPIAYEPLNKDDPYGGQRYTKQELLETSIVSVPANPAALQVARSLAISAETVSLVFGEHAESRYRTLTKPGGYAEKQRSNHRQPAMNTLAQRIEALQTSINAKKDKLAELNAAETYDEDAIEELNDQIEAQERELALRKASEAKIGLRAAEDAGLANPALVRKPLGVQQREVKGFDLLVRAMVVRGIQHFGGGDKTIDKVLDERYPGHEATAIVAKADQTIGTTTVSGWASELLQTVNQGFLDALIPYSIYPALRAGGIGVNFDGIGTVNLPGRTAGGAGGGFVAEGSPIRVGRITTASVSMTPKKLGVIVPFSRELARRSTPAIEALVRQAILEDTGVVLDTALIDAVAVSAARPAGLLNGVAATASGYGGGDYLAVLADIAALMAPFDSANAAGNITLLMNPAQARRLALMPGPLGTTGWQAAFSGEFNILRSTTVPAGRLIAIRNSDFATALGDGPEFDISEQATVHMEDTTPLEIVSTAPATADPVRSFFQTASIGVRMLMDISWVMRRTGMVQWINGTSW